MAKLLKAVRDKDDHLDCGILGAKYLLEALSEGGRADVAYKIVNQRDFPGWGHWIEQGATTLWENWDGSDSRNHIMFGHVSAWFFKHLAGIQTDPIYPGFKHFVLKPFVPQKMAWVKAEHGCPYGLIQSHWEQDSRGLRWTVVIPTNTTATICVPTLKPKEVREGKGLATRAEGLRPLEPKPGFAVFHADSGTYRFVAGH